MRNNPEAPPWSQKALRRVDFSDVRESWIPEQDAYEEALGCGHYGCVFALPNENVVLKLTSDPTEVMFIKKAMEIGEWPDGIVTYYALGKVDYKYRGRDIYAIWREAAVEVGLPYQSEVYTRDLKGRAAQESMELKRFALRLDQFKTHAARARGDFQTFTRHGTLKGGDSDYLKEVERLRESWAWDYIGWDDVEGSRDGYGEPLKYRKFDHIRGAQRTAASIRACEMIAEMMSQEHLASLVGGALGFYLEHGLLLADVHSNNVGQVEREDYSSPPWVITDPGHAVELGVKPGVSNGG